MPEWTTPSFRKAWVVQGGLSAHCLVVDDEDVYVRSTSKGEEVYVRAKKKQSKWAYKVLKGDNGLKGALQRSLVCEQLLRKFKEKAAGEAQAPVSPEESTAVD